MRKYIILLFLVSFISCSQRSQISEDLDCNPESYDNIEMVKDFDEKFTIPLPKNWKTNLYYDKNQTSIFSADTTKNLTNTYTVDVTYIYDELKLNEQFIQKFKTDLQNKRLVETTSYNLKFQEKEAYYSRSLGKRGKFNYQVCNLFIKVNSGNYIHAKAEVYGDSLVNERLCNAFSLIEKIEY